MKKRDKKPVIDLDEEEAQAEEASESKGAKPKESSQDTFRVIDRRFWGGRRSEGGNGGDASDGETQIAYVGELRDDIDSLKRETENLKSEIKSKDEKLKETISAYQALREEMEKFRTRLERDFENKLTIAKGEFFRELLVVLDGFDRALLTLSKDTHEAQAYHDGIQIIYAQFTAFLRNSGIERISPVGEQFDPNSAEALEVAEVDDDEQNNKVIEVLSAGYRYKDFLVRPAQVRVGKKKAS